MTGDPALSLLLRLKFVGFWRKQLRRLKTWKGALFALFGAGLIAVWIASFVLRDSRMNIVRSAPDDVELLIECAMLALTAVTLSNAIGFRGLYIPAAEIETLFSAPVSRGALIRMRVLTSLMRSLVGACFAGLAPARMAPHALYGFAGAFTAFLWFPILGQGVSILLGDAENRFASRLASLPHRALRVVLLAGVLIVFLSYASQSPDAIEAPLTAFEFVRSLSERPVVGALLALFKPWARAVSATSASEFWPAFGASTAILAATFVAVTRLNTDYRETALATSADVARRLARMRRGLGVGGVEARKLPLAARTPWLFGRGPFGAIAFRKTASILRKARGGLLFGVIVVAAVTVFASRISDAPQNEWVGALMVAGFGTFYLCLGLRFDFREDVDVLASIRAWPVASWRIFLATITPQVVLATSLVLAGVAATLARSKHVDARSFLAVAAVPLLVSAWVAIDNIAFLLAPSRSTPGQDGALQHAGRAFVLMLLRALALMLVIVPAAAPAVAASVVFEWSAERALWLGAAGGGLAMLLEIGGLIWLGGVVLRRFDVARDR